MTLEKQLKRFFNYEVFRIGQKEVISSVLGGNHTIAMLPTGTGKSLCYQLPGFLLDGQVVIISPLLSLMQDQAEQLMMNGEKSVVAFNSFLSPKEKSTAIRRLHQYKFIFFSPEMLKLDYVVNKLQKLNISLFVIDEAHCISQWGYDFRPDYLKLGEIREKLGNPVTLALTATATKEIKDDIISTLAFDHWNEFIYSVNRPNIALTVETLDSYQEKIDRLVELVNRLAGPGIIYFNSKKLSEQIAALLKDRGVENVMPYHGGMEQENRILIQQQFIHGQLQVICATSAFGMGINKENVRYVIHFHMPLQMEAYLQEIGRAGRDGKRSIAVLLYSPGDEQLAHQLTEGEIPSPEQLNWLIEVIKDRPHLTNKLAAVESELRKATGFTEVQWRMVADFLQVENGLPLEDAIKKYKTYSNERLQIKRKKIYDMFKWTQEKDCRRKKILKYFDEDMKIEKEEYCCDQCGIELSHFYANSTHKEAERPTYDWKKHLAEILLSK